MNPRFWGLALGFAADRLFGDPKRFHLVAGFGALATALERRIYADSRARGTVFAGVLVSSVGGPGIGPTLTSLVMGSDLLSAEVPDLDLHWLPDSRVTGATSRRVLHGDDRLALAGESLRSLYSHVLPILAEYGHMRERPLWAIAADAIANRLLWLGRALSSELENVKRVTSLLDPLTEQIGGPLPLTRYTRTDDFEAMHTHRCSCCLLFLTPQGGKCASCPRGGDLRVTAQCS